MVHPTGPWLNYEWVPLAWQPPDKGEQGSSPDRQKLQHASWGNVFVKGKKGLSSEGKQETPAEPYPLHYPQAWGEMDVDRVPKPAQAGGAWSYLDATIVLTIYIPALKP